MSIERLIDSPIEIGELPTKDNTNVPFWKLETPFASKKKLREIGLAAFTNFIQLAFELMRNDIGISRKTEQLFSITIVHYAIGTKPF